MSKKFDANKFKFYFILLLSVLPGLCYASLTPDFATISARTNVRCKIDEIEGNNWIFDEWLLLTQPNGISMKQCYKYNLNYGNLINMSFEDARNITKVKGKSLIKCSEFVVNSDFPEIFTQEIESLCKSDSDGTMLTIWLYPAFFIIGGCVILPFADLCGRKTVMSLAINLTYFAVLVDILCFNFSNSAVANAVFLLAFPSLKICSESTSNVLDHVRSLAVIVTFLGFYIPEAFYIFFHTWYWKLVKLVFLVPFLFLPLLNWYLPQSPTWLYSKHKYSETLVIIKTWNNTGSHNEKLMKIRNQQQLTCKEFKDHYKKLTELNRMEFALLVILFMINGYTLTEPLERADYVPHVQQEVLRLLASVCGIFSIMLNIPSAYIFSPRIALSLYFLVQAIFFVVLTQLSTETYVYYVLALIASLLSAGAESMLVVYATQRLPTSHRCTCMGIIRTVSFCILRIRHSFRFVIGNKIANISSAVVNILAFGIVISYRTATTDRIALAFLDISEPQCIFSKK